MKNKKISRRKFLQYGGVAAASPAAMLSACGGSGGKAPTTPTNPTNPTPPGTPGTDALSFQTSDKALVYVYLGGGNDSFNMLVPTSDAAYNQYSTSRSNLALNRNSLLALNGFTDSQNRTFGLHPAMPEMQALFNSSKLAFVANTAPVIQATSKAQFQNNSVPLPLGLMSHSDQFRHWQTARPGERENRGWFGRMADVIQSGKADAQLPMSISLAGSNILQNGVESREYSVTDEGSVGLKIQDKATPLDQAVFDGFNKILNANHSNTFNSTYLDILQQTQRHHEVFKGALDKVNVSTAFSDTGLSKELKMVARSIAASAELGLPQRTFFVHYYGWDHHDELLNTHNKMLTVLSKALGEFQTSLNELGVSDKTVTFTGSDFGRTLTSNGNGTDHGWGGNIMVIGDAVKGGKVYGDYPSLALGNDLDVGSGIMIPTTAIDEVYAELALWFGANKQGLDKLFPNLPNFYDLSSDAAPLGFMAT